VSKRKAKTSFFEVISKTRQEKRKAGLAIPTWMGKEREATAARVLEKPTMPQEQPPEEPFPPPAEEPAAAPEPEPKPKAVAAGGDGRLRFSLSYPASTAAVVVLVLLVVGAFLLGRMSAPGGEAVRTASFEPPYNPDVLQGSAEKPAPPQREEGKYYLVIERLQGDSAEDREEARRIVRFLAERGEPATVQTFRAGGKTFYGVWSLRPFGSSDSEAAIQYAERTERLGEEYFDKYKTYRFQQRRRPGAELTPSYVQHE